MKTENEIIDGFLKILNEAVYADAQAIHSLICNRVPCNTELANHPTVQVDSAPLEFENFRVGMLGVINGICEELTGERIMAVWDEKESGNIFIGFQKYKKQ